MWNSFLRNGLGSVEYPWGKIDIDPKPQSKRVQNQEKSYVQNIKL